jgi:2-isopropylmalate synthase
MISDSVAFLKNNGLEVVFDAEHFFDGYKANPEYAIACLKAAVDAGADSVDLCDTNGGSLPFEVEQMVVAAREVAPNVGIHCHNDSGCAVANTLAAIRAGARQVQGTINGYGERVGNADLLTVIADLELKMGYECVGPEKLRELTSVASYVAEICNFSVWTHAPYVGASAFAHKGGLHASAIARFPEAYNHEKPESVGNAGRMLVSELAGKASLISKAATLGVNLLDHVLECVIETPMTIAHYTGAWNGCIYGYAHTMEDHIVARLQTAEAERFIEGLEFAGAHAISGDGMGPAVTNGRKAAKNVLDDIAARKEADR